VRYDCKGKIAVVTGGSSGIGLATACALLEDGASVIIIGRSRERFEEAEKNLRLSWARALPQIDLSKNRRKVPYNFISCDLANRRAMMRLTQKLKRSAERIDLLVNCAGIYREQRLERCSPEAYDTMMGVNLFGTIFATQAVLPLMRSGSAIVNVASDAALNGNYGCPLYCASKGAVVAFTRAMALDLAPHIRVNCVCPGDIDTPLLREQLAREGCGYKLADMEAEYPLGRVGRPKEAAHIIMSLLSPAGSFVTGAIVSVDGGLTAK